MLFLLYPIVTNTAFEAFSCYDFDDREHRYLVADTSIECTNFNFLPSGQGKDHDTIKVVAMIAVFVYPFGLIVTNGVLLMAARKAILSGKPSTLSRATSFLHREYEKPFFWWELMEMVKRFFLVGIMVIVKRGTVTQLVVATMFCLVYFLFTMQTNPYEDPGDDFLMNVCSLSVKTMDKSYGRWQA